MRLRLLPSETKPLRHWTPVHVHVGSADISGRIALLEGTSLAPGESALGQIVLDQPISALTGDRFVLRDQSAQRTIGGGRVIDHAAAGDATRASPSASPSCARSSWPTTAQALDALLDHAPRGLDLGHFALARNIEPARLAALRAERDLVAAIVPGKTLLFRSRAMGRALRARMLDALEAYQQKSADSFGATAIELSARRTRCPIDRRCRRRSTSWSPRRRSCASASCCICPATRSSSRSQRRICGSR